MALNSPENQSKPEPNTNHNQTECGHEEKSGKKRGPYNYNQKVDEAIMSLSAIKGRLVEVVKHDELTRDEVIRHIAMALVYLGDAETSVRESKQVVADYVRGEQTE